MTLFRGNDDDLLRSKTLIVLSSQERERVYDMYIYLFLNNNIVTIQQQYKVNVDNLIKTVMFHNDNRKSS